MAIVVKDWNEYVMELSVPGTQTVANDLEVMVVPFPGVIRGILARLDTAGVTGTQITDIKKNGTSIFSGSGKLNFGDGLRVPTYGVYTANPTVVAKGDTLSIHTTQVNSGTPGKSLAIQINIRRSRASQLGTDNDSISATSDAV